jgi:hypothetical protein
MNRTNALHNALVLCITAPNEECKQRALELAQIICIGLTEAQINRCTDTASTETALIQMAAEECNDKVAARIGG